MIMRKLNFLFVLPLLLMSCLSDGSVDEEQRELDYAEFIDDPTEISFEEMEYDFGTVKEGEMVKHTFKFKNTGDKTLILINVKGSCGCTVPEEWPKHPIEPGGTGEIKVEFNSQDRAGNVRKNVRVEANTNPATSFLVLTGVVEK